MRSLLVLLLVSFGLPACATSAVRWHSTNPSYWASSSAGPLDVYFTHAPARPFRVVGLIVVSPNYEVREAAQIAAPVALTVGCDLITTRRDGEVAARAARPRVLVASIGSWGSFGSSGSSYGCKGSCDRTGSSGSAPPEDPIDPRMRKFWCGKYVH